MGASGYNEGYGRATREIAPNVVTAPGEKTIRVNPKENWDAFDALPRRIRDAVNYAPQRYAATSVYEFYVRFGGEYVLRRIFEKHGANFLGREMIR